MVYQNQNISWPSTSLQGTLLTVHYSKQNKQQTDKHGNRAKNTPNTQAIITALKSRCLQKHP